MVHLTPGTVTQPPSTEPRASEGRALMISYLFPPIGGGGVQRALKMARYLPEFGWHPHVLTVQQTASGLTHDPKLLDQIPTDASVHRVEETPLWQSLFARTRRQMKSQGQQRHGAPGGLRARLRPIMARLRDLFLVPDEQVIWHKPAVKAGLRIIEAHGIDVIVSTSGPATNHLVALDLTRATGLPWVADFRDPWVENLHQHDLPSMRRAREQRLEAAVIANADVISSVTRRFCDNFAARYPDAPPIALIYNGFDPADYQDLNLNTKGSSVFTAVYAGILYPKRSPATLLYAVHRLLDCGALDPSEIQLVFAGIFDYPGHSQNRELVRSLGLESIVQTPGYLPHEEILSLMAEADALMLVGDDDPRAGDYIPGKVFEYLALGKPVWGTAVPGEASDILEKTGQGFLATPGDVAGAAHQLTSLINDGEPHPSASSDIQQYRRDYQAGQLAWVFNQLLPTDNS